MKEKNELIAKFMGVDNFQIYRKETTFNKGNIIQELFEHDACYHNSWDLLMPVIQKIGNLEIPLADSSEYYNPYPMTFGMQNQDGMYMFRFYLFSLHTHQNLIEAAYSAVVEFINQYNENKINHTRFAPNSLIS